MTETHVPSPAELPPTVNLHILGHCNYACRFCYARFETQKVLLPLEDACHILDALAARGVTRVTFAGGEPTLHPDLPAMLAHASRVGLTTALVTNASRFDADYGRRVFPYLRWLVLSCDSHLDDTCRVLGRVSKRGESHPAAVASTCELVRSWNATRGEDRVRLKINVVVTTRNADEDPSEFFRSCGPERVKVLQCTRVPGENDDAPDLFCSRDAFLAYGRRLRERLPGSFVVTELDEDVYGTYAMVGPNGGFRQSLATGVVTSRPIREIGVERAWAEVGGCDLDGFARRGGVYDGGRPASGRCPKIIAIEGLDGSGKSTVVRGIAKALDAEIVANPLSDDLAARIVADASPPAERREFYRRANVAAMARAVELVYAGRTVVMDRSIASTLSYGEAELGRVAGRALLPKSVAMADRILFLAVSEPLRRARIEARAGELTIEERRLLEDDAFRERVLDGYRALATDIVSADGDPTEVLDAILACLRGDPGSAHCAVEDTSAWYVPPRDDDRPSARDRTRLRLHTCSPLR